LSDEVAADGMTIVNPVHSQIQIQNKSGVSENYTFRIYNLSGQSIQTGTVFIAGFGGGLIPLTQNYTKGVYQLELKGEKETIIRKILID